MESNIRNKLAIFDMDGTLFDTKNVNFKAYRRALAECGFCVDIDYKYYCEFCNGSNYKIFLPILVPEITAEDMRKVHDRKKALYPEYLSDARKNDQLFSLIELINPKYQVAMVTSASRKNTDDILNTFGVGDVFDFVLTQEDVKHPKPNPEGFLLAMEKAGVTKEDTLIFEDSETGIEAAERSGANYIRVYGYN